MLLSDYIDQHHNGIRAEFARSQRVAPQQVNKWLAGRWLVIEGQLYSPKGIIRDYKGFIPFDTLRHK